MIGMLERKSYMNGSHIWCCAGDGDNKEHEVLTFDCNTAVLPFVVLFLCY